MESFADTMARRKKRYGVRDFRKARIEKGTQRFKGLLSTDAARDIRGEAKQGNILNKPFLRTDDEAWAIASLTQAGLLSKDQYLNTFGSLDEPAMAPEVGYPVAKPAELDQATKPVKPDIKQYMVSNDGTQDMARFRADLDRYHQELGKWNMRYIQRVHEMDQWKMDKDRYREMIASLIGSRVGVNNLRLTKDKDALDLSLERDYFGARADPKVRRQLEKVEDKPDSDLHKLMQGMEIKGRNPSNMPWNVDPQFADNRADKFFTMLGGKNIDKDTLLGLRLMSDLLNGNVERKDITSTHGPAGGFYHSSPREGRKAKITYQNGNAAVNAAGLGGNNPARFHEFRHLVTAARNALSSGKTEPVAYGNGVTINAYDSDLEELKGMRAMGANEIVSDPDKNKDYLQRVASDQTIQGNTHDRLVGELMSNCRLLNMLMSGTPLEQIAKLKKEDVIMSVHNTSIHPPAYYAFKDQEGKSPELRTTEDFISLIINETLSSVIEIQANGDLDKPIVRELLDPFIETYYNFSKKFVDMMPKNGEWDISDQMMLGDSMFTGNFNNEKAKHEMTKYTPKSAKSPDWIKRLRDL